MKQQTKLQQTEISKIFNELKLKGLIDKKRKLVINSLESNLRGSRNKIYYNPLFMNFNKNSLRYLLLHEEAHNTLFQHSTWILAISFISTFITYYYFHNLLISLITLILPIFLFRKFITKDESNADLWSAERLKRFYYIGKPSEIMKNAFKEYHKNKSKRNLLSKFMSFMIKFIGYHPSCKNRIKLVKDRIG